MLYPKLNSSRTLIDLSGIWNFKLDNGHGFEEKWQNDLLKDAMTMAIPASYNDQREGLEIRDHYGWVFYQTIVEIPTILYTQRLVLRFGSVTHFAKVYLNGKLICEHKGGFLPFEMEINKYARSGKNLLTVAVDNKIDFSTLPMGKQHEMEKLGHESETGVKRKLQNHPNFDFFNYCGIQRPVKIYTTPRDFIEDISLVTSVEGTAGVIDYEIKTHGTGEVRISIFDEDNQLINTAKGSKGRLTIESAHLWWPGKAYLYKAVVEFNEDLYEQSFGIRTVEVKGTEFLINGQPFYFKGFGKHEDSAIHGRGLDEVLNVKDISLMNWIGANSFRTSHYPYAEEMLNLCDREGIVVIGETPAVGIRFNNLDFDIYTLKDTKAHHEDVIRDMIERDKNHPCIVMWSIANEPDTVTNAQSAYDYFMPLYELAHECDPQNRPVTVVSLLNDYVKDLITPAMDVICLNRYYGWYDYSGDLEAARQAMKHEFSYWETWNKPVLITEYGADTIAGLHATTPNMFTEEYQVDYYQSNNQVLDECNFIIGEHCWNFADFATFQGLMRADGNKKGIFTRDRRPKLAAHYFKNRWHQIDNFNYKKK